jgi:hypothetical protein
MNKTQNLEHMDVHDEFLVFKGVFFELAPVSIPLCVVVLIQNTVLFVDYYRERAKLVPSFFMGIAMTDILKAQGEMILAVISILVYSGVWEIEVLYNSLLYYTVTALPGLNCSKVLNLALTLTLTVNIVNPFRRINTVRVKRVVLIICALVTGLHLLDTMTFLIARAKLFRFNKPDWYMHKMVYWFLLDGFQSPGFVTIAAVSCARAAPGEPHCGLNHTPIVVFGILAVFLYFAGPPIIMLVCMASSST